MNWRFSFEQTLVLPHNLFRVFWTRCPRGTYLSFIPLSVMDMRSERECGWGDNVSAQKISTQRDRVPGLFGKSNLLASQIADSQ
jgi:hypothetical protein